MRSMTTFARHQATRDETTIKMEFRSLNHRYSEVNCRMPRWMHPLEDRIKKLVRKWHERGKVDLTIGFEGKDMVATGFRPQTDAVKGFLGAVDQLKREVGLPGELTVQDLLAVFRDAVLPEQEDVDIHGFWDFLSGELEVLLAMARRHAEMEGEALRADLESHVTNIESILNSIENRKRDVLPQQKAALKERVMSALDGTPLAEERLIQEYAFLGERLDITEELVRARSHVTRFMDLMGESGPIGRRLDFLLQELFREINTIASKAQDAEISQMVVEAKGEVEKLREQVQNII